MANTYTQLHIQTVFAVKYREALIETAWEDKLYKYITGIIQMNGHKVLQVNGMPDHIHILFGMRPAQSLSDLMKVVKSGSSKWINDQGLAKRKFAWQNGYGAFSYSKSQIPRVATYIQNQKEHHRKKSFQKEYLQLLKKYGIKYDDRFLFNPVQ